MQYKRRHLVIAAGAVLAASLGATLSAASASSSGTDLRFKGTVVAFTAIPTRGDTDPQQPGDQTYFNVQLTDHGHPAGYAPHHCTAITADYSLCDSVVDLSNGQLTLATALGGKNNGSVIHVAITGGTGAYEHAHGQLTLSVSADGTQTWLLDIT